MLIARILFIFLVLHACAPGDAFGWIAIWFEQPLDDFNTRQEMLEREEFRKRLVMIERLEHKLVTSLKTQVAIKGRFGGEIPFDPRRFVRPIGACDFASLQNVPANELDGLTDRFEFFPIGQSGGILLYRSLKGEVYKPPYLFLRIDSKFVRLSDAGQVKRRLEWEYSKMNSIFKYAELDESQITPNDDELKTYEGDAKKRRAEFFEYLQDSMRSKENAIEGARRK